MIVDGRMVEESERERSTLWGSHYDRKIRTRHGPRAMKETWDWLSRPRKMLLPDFGNFKSSSESAGRSCLGRVWCWYNDCWGDFESENGLIATTGHEYQPYETTTTQKWHTTPDKFRINPEHQWVCSKTWIMGLKGMNNDGKNQGINTLDSKEPKRQGADRQTGRLYVGECIHLQHTISHYLYFQLHSVSSMFCFYKLIT